MAIVDRILRFAHTKDSLHERIRTVQLVLVLLMLIPALVAITLMMVFSRQYHGVIGHMEEVSLLRPLISESLLNETMDIVVGRTRFDAGTQFETLEETAARLDRLVSQNPASRTELEVSRRLLDTLRSYVVELGAQITQGSTVDENLLLHEEIVGVASLFNDMLGESIATEITASAEASRGMQRVISITLLVEIALVALSLLFATMAQRSLSDAIRVPLGRMQQFAGRIAGGALTERVPLPDVEELKDLSYSLNKMAFQLERLLEESTREQENLKKSELRALQAQITPHFLYNTLDAIIWLAEARRTGEVITITGALSNFFRTSLNNGKDWISVRQELEHLEGYLTIQKIRYRDILEYRLEIDEALVEYQILKLLIQPLVENALYHGIKNRRRGGLLVVSVKEEAGRMRICVEDNGIGMTDAQRAQVLDALSRSEPLSSDTGYGLYSVDKRIKLYYSQPEGLRIESTEGQGTRISFSVPLRR